MSYVAKRFGICLSALYVLWLPAAAFADPPSAATVACAEQIYAATVAAVLKQAKTDVSTYEALNDAEHIELLANKEPSTAEYASLLAALKGARADCKLLGTLHATVATDFLVSHIALLDDTYEYGPNVMNSFPCVAALTEIGSATFAGIVKCIADGHFESRTGFLSPRLAAVVLGNSIGKDAAVAFVIDQQNQFSDQAEKSRLAAIIENINTL